MQCDPAQGSCWCVLGSGEEVPGSRVAGSPPACESKLCRPVGAPGAGGDRLLTSSFTQAGGAPETPGQWVQEGRREPMRHVVVVDSPEVETGVYFLKNARPWS